MSRQAFAIVAFGMLPVFAFAQAGSTGSPLRGVWRLQEVVITGGTNPRTVKSPQPSLQIFTDKHYSGVGINTTNGEARPEVATATDPAKLTDAEKLARYEHWGPFNANAGTYEIKGNVLIRTAIVAKNQAGMTATPNPDVTTEFKVDGNTLWLITRNAAVKPPSETRARYTRLE